MTMVSNNLQKIMISMVGALVASSFFISATVGSVQVI